MNTIADLATDLAPAAGDGAIVSGYAAAGDDGGGDFYWEGDPPDSAIIAGTIAADAAIASASDTVPIQITTSSPHPCVTGQAVLLEDVGGSGACTGGFARTTIVQRKANHGLATNQQAMIAGYKEQPRQNGTWRLTVPSNLPSMHGCMITRARTKWLML
ncbi:MAG TPA: hypothetical protein VIY49_00925 [Bryobacteraceae bacterium]